MIKNITDIFNRIKSYFEKENFKGWSLYDCLNSRFCKDFKLDRTQFFRWKLIKVFKAISKTLKVSQNDIFVPVSGGASVNFFKQNKQNKKGLYPLTHMMGEIEILEKLYGVTLYFNYINSIDEKELYNKKFKNNNKVTINRLYAKEKMLDFIIQNYSMKSVSNGYGEYFNVVK